MGNPLEREMDRIRREQQAAANAPLSPVLPVATPPRVRGPEELAAQLRAANQLGRQKSQQESSEAIRLSQRLGLPAEVVASDLEAVRTQDFQRLSEDIAKSAPVTASWGAEPTRASAVGQSGWEKLSRIERIFGTGLSEAFLQARQPGLFQPSYRSAERDFVPTPLQQRGAVVAEFARAKANFDLGNYQFLQTPASRARPEVQREIDRLRQRAAGFAVPDAGVGAGAVAEEAARSVANIVASITEALEGSAIGAAGAASAGALGALTAGPAAVPAAGALAAGGAATGSAARIYQFSSGLAIDQFLQAGIDPEAADALGRTVGLGSAALEVVGLNRIGKLFGLNGAALASRVAQRGLQDLTTRRAVMEGVKAAAGTIAVETGTEVAQQALELGGEQVGRMMSDLPSITGDRVLDELWTTAYTTVLGMGLLAVPGAAITTVNELGRVEQAKKAQDFLTALGDSVESTELRTQLPEQFQQLLQQNIDEYGPVQNVSIPVERFVAYWQERNLDPRVVAEQILGDTTAYDQALEQGTADVVIPLADFVAKVAGTEHYAGLLPDIRLRPGDLTVREAEALAPELERSLDELRGDLETAASATPTEASAVRVYEAVLEQITATGQYTAEQARPQAQVIANLYSTMARRANLDPFQLWQSRNISILPPVQAEVLYDAVAEMEEAMAENPSSPRAVAAVQRVEQLRTEMSATPAGAAVAEQVLTPMVMPISAVDLGQRVVLEDGRSAVVTGREAGNVVVRMAGAPEGETTPIAGDREVQVPGAVLRQARAVPTPRLEATANLRAVFDFARKNQFRVNRDFKLALQARAQEAAAEDGVDLTEFNTATLDYLVRVGLADAEYAMETNPNAIGWYERKVREALAISALTYPEIETDQNARFAFIVALAVTSNGMKVDKNFELADQVYRAYRETGQMPTNVKAGTAQGAMNTAFKLFNELVPLYGMDTLRQAMITQFDVGTLKAMGFKITGEHVDVIVRGAAIFGPKIGNGFFANLYGFFDALTIDRWLMRTWGRWTGNLVEDRPDMVAEKSTELARLVAIISQNAEAKQTIEKMLKLSLDAPIEDIGKAVRKASAKESNRTVMMDLMIGGEDIGDQLRLVGNSLAGYLDGQIEAPTADVRKKIRGVFQRVLEQLQVNNPDLTMADLQALLWYPEKRLYDSAVMEVDEAEAEYADDEAPDYSNAAAKLARSKGITEEAIQDVLRRERAIDGRTAAARRQLEGVGADPAASADVEGLSRQARRNFVARSVLRRLRSDIAGDGTKSETYARKGRGVRASLRLLGQTVDVVGQYTPSIKFRNRIEAANGTALEFFELAPDATSAQVFTDAITAAKNSTPFGAAVFVYSPEEYAGMRLFVAEDGQTGFALKPDGDIVSVFSYGVPGGARGAIELAIQQGGRKLDAFATVLPEYYFAHGMREVARLPWDDTQAPPDWDTNTFADFNDGRPDVVFMVFDPEFSGPYEVAPYAADYGAALAAQDRALADLDTRVQPVVAPQVLRQAAGDVPDQSVAQLVDRATDPRWVYEDLPETIDVDGVTRPTRNSLGQQITFNAKAMRAFWRWFGDSKVVDAQGRPIMMYHGTVADVDFDTFRLNPREMGVHTGTPEQATDRVRALSGDEFMDEAVGPRILELYVKADNPLRLEDEGGFSPRSHAVPQLVDLGILSVEQGFELSQIPWTEASYSEVYNRVIDALRERGYDSIVYFNQYEGTQTASGGDDSYIVFTKQQVKSPVNVGTFSPRLASTLRQRAGARPNAFIIPGIRRTTIGLMNTADLSSLMHEFSHDYLNLLFDLAATDGATEQLKADAALVLQTFGVTDRTQLTVEHQERWARMFEAYLEDGKAPSRALDRAFARFRAWLSAIYRMARSVLVPVSPEIRGVFDRMLATEAEIDTARTASVGDPLFGSAAEAGMTDAEFAAYLQKQADARAFSEATLLREMLAERRKETRAAWQERREEVEGTVRLQVEAEPVQQVVHFLRTGELLNGDPLPEGVEPVKLSKALLVQRYGEEVLRSLPKGVYSVEGGVDPDVLALSFGIPSGDALITEMQAFEPYKARIKRLTAEIMAREFPDLMNDSMALANAAMAAVHRSETDQVLVEELRILGRSDANIPPTDLPTIKRLAREIIGGTAVRNINRERFRQAELSAGRKAYAAMRRGDASTAAFHKRQQLLNHILYREATRALEMAEKARKFFARMAKGTTQQRLGLAGWEYQERMNVLLAQYEFVRVSLRQLDRRSSLQAWIEQQRLEGIDVEIPLSVLVNDIASQQLNYRLLTADQLQGVYDSGQQIYYIATRKNALLADAKKRAMQQVEDEVVASIAASHEIKPRLPDYVPSPFKRLADFLKKIDAWHIKPEFLFTWLDGEKPMGPVWSALFKPIADAGVAEAKMLREALPELERLFNMIPKARRKQFLERSITVPGTDAKLTGSTVLAMALNWGNEGNREALLQSTVSGQQLWTREMVEAAFRQLTADEWRMVQAAWDYIDTFWPQISALQRELTGVSPQKIEASPFVVRTADGETIQMRGGYYPLVYDRNYNWAQFKADAAADVKDLGATTYTRAVTRHGFTEQRVGSGGRPVKLDLSVLSEHVLNVIHDLTHRKAILDVGRLIERPGIREAIEGAAGREMYRIIRPWLQRVASDQRPAATPIEDLLGRARTGVTVVNMGLKMTTAIVQPIGYLQTVESLGVKYARRGLQAFFRNPKKLVADVLEQSAELRARQQNFDRDVRDSTRYLAAKGKMTQVTQAYFVFTGLMDMAVAIPSWYGAYLKSVETIRPGDHDAAVAYADQVVRTSQGSGAAKDLALIQGGGNAQRLFTLFYSYFSALYNLMRRSGTTLAREGSKDVPRFIASMALLWFLPAVLSELIAGRGPEDDEDEMGWALTQLLRYPASTIVGLRDLAAAIGPEAYDYELSPVTSAFRSVVKTVNNAGEIVADAVEGAGVDITQGQLKEFLNAVGYWGQLPTRQMWITGAYLYDVMMGYETPDSVGEFTRNLLFARPQ